MVGLVEMFRFLIKPKRKTKAVQSGPSISKSMHNLPVISDNSTGEGGLGNGRWHSGSVTIETFSEMPSYLINDDYISTLFGVLLFRKVII
jgi:hypothetical protein